MDSKEYRSLQEAYLGVYGDQISSGMREEVEAWVNSLIEEGYDLSEYTWDEMAEIYLDEANRGDEYVAAKMHPNEVRGAKQKRRNKSFDAGHTHGRGPRMTSGQETEIENMPNGGSAEVARQKTLMRQRYTKNVRGVGTKGRGVREQVDIYDIILSHLLYEGYADSVDAAEKIMCFMSEDWRDSIVEATAMAKRGLNEPAIR